MVYLIYKKIRKSTYNLQKNNHNNQMETKTNTHQELMDQAYAIWQENNDWSQTELFYNITPAQRAAVVLGNINYQVNNGGLYQYIDNGYYEDQKPVIKMLIKQMEKGGYEFLEITLRKLVESADAGYKNRLDSFDTYYYKQDNVLAEMEAFIAKEY